MIRSFKHKGLEKYFLKGTKSGIQAKHATRLRIILGRLNVATSPKDMDLAGLKLHELSGRKKEIWSAWVSGNWRVTFRFEGKDAEAVDCENYKLRCNDENAQPTPSRGNTAGTVY